MTVKQLYLDVPSALSEALNTFSVLEESTYATKALGSSHQIEIMTCDCARSASGDHLCGEDSNCINRLTSMECVDHHPGHTSCSNRRFQDKRYADIDVFHAGKKGFGVRALSKVHEGDLIYEYIGEVVDEARFMKRRRVYEQKGVKHFYFMMLQKDEFIDATAKGSIARFCNHSCNPNSYVDKWVVGPKVRMGIFAKRDIIAGEEITFDYNVDRYGAEPQTCYCGEDNCVGIIGGKKQTSGLHIPQSMYDVLGITPEEETEWMHEMSREKKKELDDYTGAQLPLKEIGDVEEVSKIMSSLMQSRESWLVNKLVRRILTTESTAVQGEVLRMHGYEIFSTLLNQWQESADTATAMLEILMKWPRLTKNKISSSKIESVVTELAKKNQDRISEMAQSLLDEWSSLQMAYRIPRQKREKSDQNDSTEPESPEKIEPLSVAQTPGPALSSASAERQAAKTPKLPPGWTAVQSSAGKTYFLHTETGATTWERPRDEKDIEREKQLQRERERDRERENLRLQQEREKQASDLQKIIEEAALSLVSELEPPTPARSDGANGEKPDTGGNPSRSVTRQLAKYVPKIVWKHEPVLGHNKCKKHAKEIVQVLVDKEVRKNSGRSDFEFDLTDEKKKKIKTFVAGYMEKVLARQKAKAHPQHENGEPSSKKTKVA